MRLLVRADANATIGLGHVMRCLALAQAWQDLGGTATFASSGALPRVESEGFSVERIDATPGSDEDARRTVELARSLEAAAVLDGYAFRTSFQRALVEAGRPLLVVDDNGEAGEYVADLVLNQNVHAREELYVRRAPRTRLLLGTKHALLRREVRRRRVDERAAPPLARRVLVTLGGSDPDDATSLVLRALEQAAREDHPLDLEVRVVVGGANPNETAVRAAAARVPRARVERDLPSLAEPMEWADLAVAAAGSTSWELAFFGVPTLAVVLADNQAALAERLAELGVVENLGRRESLDACTIASRMDALARDRVRREGFSMAARRLVDGRGAERVAKELAELVETR